MLECGYNDLEALGEPSLVERYFKDLCQPVM